MITKVCMYGWQDETEGSSGVIWCRGWSESKWHRYLRRRSNLLHHRCCLNFWNAATPFDLVWTVDIKTMGTIPKHIRNPNSKSTPSASHLISYKSCCHEASTWCAPPLDTVSHPKTQSTSKLQKYTSCQPSHYFLWSLLPKPLVRWAPPAVHRLTWKTYMHHLRDCLVNNIILTQGSTCVWCTHEELRETIECSHL